MKAIELLRKLHHLIEVEGVDPDEEIFVTRRVKGELVYTRASVDFDWLWKDIADEEDSTKVLEVSFIEE